MTRDSFPVPVFAAVGAGAWGPVQQLRAQPGLRLVASPRHASVLLVAGAVPLEHSRALDLVHDQLPHPRGTVVWAGEPVTHPLTSTVVTGPPRELVRTIVEVHHRVVGDRRSSEPDRLPDEDPDEWRGVGPHGQGGEGMMGGTPYGRPMAMTGDDPDGLALDELRIRLGPFLGALPPGLVLDVTLQGEVIRAAEARRPDQPADALGSALPDATGDDPVGEARRDLRWLAHALHVHGLDAHAARAARLATDPTATDARARFARLRRQVRRSGVVRGLRGVGSTGGTDAADRWAGRLDRIERALSGEEAPHIGPAPAVSIDDLGDRLPGTTLGDAVSTIVSLGLAAGPAEPVVLR